MTGNNNFGVAAPRIETEEIAQLTARIAAVSEADLDGGFLYVNEGFCALSGYSAVEIVGLNHRILRSDEHDEAFFAHLWEALKRGEVWQGVIKNKKKNGGYYWTQTTISPVLDENKISFKYISVGYDITAQIEEIKRLQKSEEEVREQYSKLKQREQSVNRVYALQQALVNAPGLGVMGVNLDGVVVTANDSAQALLGYRSDELLRRTTPLLFHEQSEVFQRALTLSKTYKQEINAGFETFLTPMKQGDNRPQEWTLIRKNGEKFPSEVVLSEIKDGADKIIGYLYLFRDLSTQKANETRALDEAHEARQLLQQKEAETTKLAAFQDAVLQSAGRAILITDPNGIVINFNAAAEQALGYLAEEIESRLPLVAFHDLQEIVDYALQLNKESGRRLLPGFEVLVANANENKIDTHEWTYIRKDGSRFPVELTLSVLRDSDGQILGYMGLAQDITDRKAAEQIRATQAEEMAAILQEKMAQEEEMRQNAEELMAVNEALEEKSRLAYEQAQAITLREAELRNTNAFQRALLDGAGLAIFTALEDGLLIACNDVAETLLGYTEKFIQEEGLSLSALFDFEEIVARARELSQSEGRTIFPGPEIFRFIPDKGEIDITEWNMIRKDGSRFIGELSYSAARDENGAIVAYVGIVRDVTRQKEQEKLFEQLLEANPVPVVVSDMQTGIIKFTNSALLNLMQFERAEIIGAPSPNFYVYPEKRAEIIQTVLRDGRLRNYEVELRRNDGSTVVTVFFGEVIHIDGRPHFYVGIVDVSQRKQMEAELHEAFQELQARQEELRQNLEETAAINEELHRASLAREEQERFLRAIIDALPVAVFSNDVDNHFRISICNKQMENFMGLNADKIVGHSAGELLDEALAGELTQANRQVVRTGVMTQISEIQLARKDQPLRYIETTKAPIFNHEGEVSYVLNIWNDITERKKADIELQAAYQELQAREEEIRQNLEETAAINEELNRTGVAMQQQERFLNSIIENLPVALMCKDVQNDFRFTVWNQKAEEIFGYPFDAVMGKTVYDFYPMEEAAFFHQKDQEVVKSGKLIDIPAETLSNPKLGKIFLHTLKVPIRDETGAVRYLLGISENITERKKAEDELRQSQARLADATEMANLATWELDFINGQITLDDKNMRMLGLDAQALGKRTFSVMDEFVQWVVPEDAMVIGSELQKAATQTDPEYKTEFNYRALTPTGEIRNLHVVGRIKTDSEGFTYAGYGTTQDFTEQKRMEEQIRADKVVLDAALKIADLGTWNLDLRTLVLTPDDRHYEFMEFDFSIPFERPMNVHDFFARFVHPDDHEHINSQLVAALTTDDPDMALTFEYRLLTVHGGVKTMLVNTRMVFEDGKPIGIYGTTQNISDRKAFEDAMLESQNMLSEAFTIAKLAHWEWYLEMNLLQLSDHFFAIIGTNIEVEGGYILSVDDYIERFVHPADREPLKQVCDEFIGAGDLDAMTNAEYRIVRIDNKEIRYVTTNIRFIKQDGKGVGLFGTIQDVTAQKLAEAEIHASRALLSEAMKIANLASWRMDVEKQCLMMNEDSYRILGTDVETEGGYAMPIQRYIGFIHPDDRHLFGINMQAFRESDDLMRQFYHEYRINRPNGELAYVGVSVVANKDPKTGVVAEVYGTTQDVTRRKLDELAIRESEARLSDAMAIANLGTFIADSINQTVKFDDRLFALLGTSVEEEGGYETTMEEFINRFVHLHDVGVIPASIMRSFECKEDVFRDTFELRCVQRDGQLRYFMLSVRVMRNEFGQMSRAIGVAQDITKRKLEEIFQLERQTRIEKQDAALSLLAKSDIFTGGSLKNAFDELTRVIAETLTIARAGLWLYAEEQQAIRCANLYETATSTYSEGVILYANDYPRYFEAIAEEKIIAVKYAAIDPRTNEFTDNYLSVLGITSMLDVPVRRGGKMIGVICNEHIGLAREWFEDEINFAVGVADLIALAMEAQERQQALDELRIKEGELQRTVSERTDALETLKKTQGLLVQSEKMASLGQLIAGVAHEVNTPISAVKASARNIVRGLPAVLTEVPQLLKKLPAEDVALFIKLVEQSTDNSSSELTTLEERQYRIRVKQVLDEFDIDNASELAKELVEIRVIDKIEEYIPLFQHELSQEILDKVYKLGQFKKNLDNIDVAADKTARVVKALKNYSRVQTSERFTEVLLQDSIDTILTVYANQLKYGVAVEKNFERLKPVPVYPDEIGQVWTNIITNAVQAMKGKGKIIIDVFTLDSEYAGVRITDHGPGIPADVLPRIFEPFFTTKPQGEGTGLGLDIVKKIIEKHNGRLSVDTKLAVNGEGGGTTFLIALPFVQPENKPEHEVVAEEEDHE